MPQSHSRIQLWLIAVSINLAFAVTLCLLLFSSDDLLLAMAQFQNTVDYVLLVVSSIAHLLYFRKEEWFFKLGIAGLSLVINGIAMVTLGTTLSGDSL